MLVPFVYSDGPLMVKDMNSQPQQSHSTAGASLDPDEIARFQALAQEWWNPNGKFRPLHQIGPARLQFIRDELVRHFSLGDAQGADGRPVLKPLKGLSVLDIGCGGGLISEPLTRLGANVTGIDPGQRNIDIAVQHAREQGLDITYQAITVEELAKTGQTFDAVVCLEVVEHVPDVGAFVKAMSGVLKPGGMLILSTINRNLKSYALAIVAAEYLLRWLPKGTHQWERFITPDELSRFVADAGLECLTTTGMTYNPLKDVWSLNNGDIDVNYLLSACKAPA